MKLHAGGMLKQSKSYPGKSSRGAERTPHEKY